MKQKYSLDKYLKQWGYYFEARVIKDYSNKLKPNMNFQRFILAQLGVAMNKIESINRRYYWIIVHHDDKLRLVLTTLHMFCWEEVFNLASKKYYQYDQKDHAKKYLQNLATKYNLEIHVEENKGVLDGK